jgi:drug/metabolite transporter (DMT)-like permease
LTPAALALVLTAAVAHALWNLAAKRVTADRVVLVWLYIVGSVVLWVPPALVWALVSGQRPAWSWLLAAGASAALHVAYDLVLVHGYAAGDLNLVYPLARGVGPLVVLVVAVGLLGEAPGPEALSGAALVVLGVLVMTLGGGTDRRRAAGTFWGVATGLTIAAYTLWDHHAVTTLAVPPLTYFCLGLLLQAVPLTVSTTAGATRRAEVLPVLRRHWREVLAVAVLSRRLRCHWSRRCASPASSSARCSAGGCSASPGRPAGSPGPPSCWAASPCSAWPDGRGSASSRRDRAREGVPDALLCRRPARCRSW